MDCKRVLLGDQQGGRVLSKHQNGASLIEVAVSLVIVSILMVAGMPSFSEFLQNRKVRNAAEALHSGLSLAKAEAVRRNTVIAFTLNGTGWAMSCTNCTGALPSMSAVELSADVATSATTTTIGFNGFGRVPALAAGSEASIDITNSKGACQSASPPGTIRCLRILVTPGGQIRTCDPKLTTVDATSPQACPAT